MPAMNFNTLLDYACAFKLWWLTPFRRTLDIRKARKVDASAGDSSRVGIMNCNIVWNRTQPTCRWSRRPFACIKGHYERSQQRYNSNDNQLAGHCKLSRRKTANDQVAHHSRREAGSRRSLDPPFCRLIKVQIASLAAERPPAPRRPAPPPVDVS
ncbi:hypothetical protein EVAR_64638_1 [Eumeta japonica]|uniref:Uncharacterized protein n=1 Tax=Eumeta variegata TaxID=151549 RepID=A0A4C1ZC57_EUMVA|nr:hypothetical protein EVAR_64638_1 [Eumeta japonica]